MAEIDKQRWKLQQQQQQQQQQQRRRRHRQAPGARRRPSLPMTAPDIAMSLVASFTRRRRRNSWSATVPVLGSVDGGDGGSNRGSISSTRFWTLKRDSSYVVQMNQMRRGNLVARAEAELARRDCSAEAGHSAVTAALHKQQKQDVPCESDAPQNGATPTRTPQLYPDARAETAEGEAAGGNKTDANTTRCTYTSSERRGAAGGRRGEYSSGDGDDGEGKVLVTPSGGKSAARAAVALQTTLKDDDDEAQLASVEVALQFLREVWENRVSPCQSPRRCSRQPPPPQKQKQKQQVFEARQQRVRSKPFWPYRRAAAQRACCLALERAATVRALYSSSPAQEQPPPLPPPPPQKQQLQQRHWHCSGNVQVQRVVQGFRRARGRAMRARIDQLVAHRLNRLWLDGRGGECGTSVTREDVDCERLLCWKAWSDATVRKLQTVVQEKAWRVADGEFAVETPYEIRVRLLKREDDAVRAKAGSKKKAHHPRENRDLEERLEIEKRSAIRQLAAETIAYQRVLQSLGYSERQIEAAILTMYETGEILVEEELLSQAVAEELLNSRRRHLTAFNDDSDSDTSIDSDW